MSSQQIYLQNSEKELKKVKTRKIQTFAPCIECRIAFRKGVGQKTCINPRFFFLFFFAGKSIASSSRRQGTWHLRWTLRPGRFGTERCSLGRVGSEGMFRLSSVFQRHGCRKHQPPAICSCSSSGEGSGRYCTFFLYP